ncbi:MAG: DUF6768 family protein [Phycisphaerales bacterium]
MSSLDDKIREALKREDAELFGEVAGEASLPELVAESFRGKYRFFVMLSMGATLVFTVAMFFCGYKVFTSDEFHEHILWAMGFFFSAMAVGMLKTWTWMELNRIAVTREIKRVELQIALLAKRLEK